MQLAQLPQPLRELAHQSGRWRRRVLVYLLVPRLGHSRLPVCFEKLYQPDFGFPLGNMRLRMWCQGSGVGHLQGKLQNEGQVATGVAVEVAVPVWVPVAVAVELESEWSEFWLTTAATSLVQRHYNESLAAPFRCRWKTFGLLFSIV